MPSAGQLYRATTAALESAARHPRFGEMMLASRAPREVWLSEYLAEALRLTTTFEVRTEMSDGRDGRVDVAVLDRGGGGLRSVIEVKNHYCCATSSRTKRHGTLWATYMDFLKRAHLGAPMQQVLLFGSYLRLGEDPLAAGIRDIGGVARTLRHPPQQRVAWFADDLEREFGTVCEIVPPAAGNVGGACVWTARHAGTEIDVRAWVLRLRPGVTTQELCDRLWRRAPATYHPKCQLALRSRGITCAPPPPARPTERRSARADLV